MDVYARGVNVNLTPLTSNRGALATDARGCSLWRYLLERPPPAWESRVQDPLGARYEFGRCGPGRGCYTFMWWIEPNAVNKVMFDRVEKCFYVKPDRTIKNPQNKILQ